MFVWMNRRLKLNYLFSIYSLCWDTFCSPSPVMYGRLAQWIQYNKFVKSGSKNQALINWTTANMKLNDNQSQIRGTDMNELIVWGGNFSYKSTKQSTSIILIVTIFSLFFWSLSSRVYTLIYTTSLPSSLPYTWIVDGLCWHLSHQPPL